MSVHASIHYRILALTLRDVKIDEGASRGNVTIAICVGRGRFVGTTVDGPIQHGLETHLAVSICLIAPFVAKGAAVDEAINAGVGTVGQDVSHYVAVSRFHWPSTLGLVWGLVIRSARFFAAGPL